MAARRKLSAAWTVFGALAPLWMFSPGPGTLDNPVVDDGRVFATFHTFSESRLYALALATGKEQWHRPIEMTGILVAARGRLLFMDRDKSLHSIDAATGRDLWTAPVFFFLAAGDSGIYVLDSDRRLAILDDSTGRVARRTGVRGDELTATSSSWRSSGETVSTSRTAAPCTPSTSSQDVRCGRTKPPAPRKRRTTARSTSQRMS